MQGTTTGTKTAQALPTVSSQSNNGNKTSSQIGKLPMEIYKALSSKDIYKVIHGFQGMTDHAHWETRKSITGEVAVKMNLRV